MPSDLAETTRDRSKGLCLLSLDTGGPRAISQLKILGELMHRVNFDAQGEGTVRPRAIFDMIGGVGTGGFIAILFVILGFTVDQALAEFIELNTKIFQLEGSHGAARTAALNTHINNLISKHGIGAGDLIVDPNKRADDCKLVVPISFKAHIGPTCTIRNFSTQEQGLDLTIAEALQATLAIPPLFSPTPIIRDTGTIDYIGADFVISNPVREIIAEAHKSFGPECLVACLLSLGCGHPGIVVAPKDYDLVNWNDFLEKLVTSSEYMGQALETQMGHLGIYHRFSVTRGLESTATVNTSSSGDVLTQTAIYLSDPSLSRKANMCVDTLKLRDGVATLEQLVHSGGPRVLPPHLPPSVKPFVMRKEPWEFIERTMLKTEDPAEDGQKILVVTGPAGCGKTQLVLKFLRLHGNKFASAFFVEGSSKARIRADIIRHVRSLGVEYSQESFEECLEFLSQLPPKGPRLIFYDNVDDPHIDLLPLLPQGDGCAIIVTSRNFSIGELSPDCHLELDVMSMEEAVELLVNTSSSPTTEKLRKDAQAIATALGCLPIALTQARSYLRQTKCSAGAYLEKLLISPDIMLSYQTTFQRDTRYTSTNAAFKASFDSLSPKVQQFLLLLSFFHCTKFPLAAILLVAKRQFSDYETTEFLENGQEYHVGREMLKHIFQRDGRWNFAILDEMTNELQNYSLITLVPGLDTTLLNVHPLVHEWVHTCILKDEFPAYEAAAILALALSADYEDVVLAKYTAPHVMHLSHLWGDLHVNNAGAFARIMYGAGFMHKALQLHEQVVKELRVSLSPDEIGLAMALWDLAFTYRELGRFAEAAELDVEVRGAFEIAYGEDDMNTMSTLNNLADCYRELGRLVEAEELLLKVRPWREKTLGSHHPHTMYVWNSLGLTYYAMGRVDEAKELQVEVLRLRKEVLGDHHHDTMTASSNLADTYRTLGQLAEAKELEVETLRLCKEVLGEQHPTATRAMLDLAETYEKLGQKSDALELITTADAIISESLGKTHPQYKRCQELKSRGEGLN